METGLPAPAPIKPGHPGQIEQPYVHSPVAAHEPPPVRNMSTSTASTSGSVELPQMRPHEPAASQSAGTFMSSQVGPLLDLGICQKVQPCLQHITVKELSGCSTCTTSEALSWS